MRAPGIVGLMLGFALACSSEPAPPASDTVSRDECLNQSDGVLCMERGEALTCRANEVVESVDCTQLGQVCMPPVGCLACRPGERACAGNDVTECRADGSGSEVVEECD